MTSRKVPVIVDEMNTMFQLHRINVKGVAWNAFFRALNQYTDTKVKPYFACANITDKTEKRYENREAFFTALSKHGIRLLQGFAVRDSKSTLVEKGVDVLCALQIYKEALNGAKDIIICSADSDLVPAILEAQSMGARVHVVVSDYTPCKEVGEIADRIISLESVLELIEDKHIRYQVESKPYIFTQAHSKCFKPLRKGVCSA